jgi:hypothetical protein
METGTKQFGARENARLIGATCCRHLAGRFAPHATRTSDFKQTRISRIHMNYFGPLKLVKIGEIRVLNPCQSLGRRTLAKVDQGISTGDGGDFGPWTLDLSLRTELCSVVPGRSKMKNIFKYSTSRSNRASTLLKKLRKKQRKTNNFLPFILLPNKIHCRFLTTRLPYAAFRERI